MLTKIWMFKQKRQKFQILSFRHLFFDSFPKLFHDNILVANHVFWVALKNRFTLSYKTLDPNSNNTIRG